MLEEIAQGESASLEFKEFRPKNSLKFTKTVVAFANGRGGRILFGVEDGSGIVKGIDNTIVQKEMDVIADTIANCCTPAVSPEITLANVEGKSVIVVNVRGGLKTPYYVRKLGIRKGTFQRVGATTREVEEYTLKSLILDGENQSFDRQVAKGVKMSKREVASVCRLMTETARQNCENAGRNVTIKAMTAVRLEILSPGGLLKEITIEEVRRGYSKIRNKGLAEALIYMHEVESWGGGVARYYTAMAKAGLKPPVAEEQGGFFKVVFWRPQVASQAIDATTKTTTDTASETVKEAKSVEKSVEKGVEKSVEKITHVLSENPYATQRDLAAATGLSIRGVEKNLSKLKSAGVIRRIGPDRGGHWEVVSRPNHA